MYLQKREGSGPTFEFHSNSIRFEVSASFRLFPYGVFKNLIKFWKII